MKVAGCVLDIEDASNADLRESNRSQKTWMMYGSLYKMKMAVKMRAEYKPVLHMPVLKEGRERGPLHASDPYGPLGYPLSDASPDYLVTGTHPYPSAPGVALTADTQMQKMPSEAGVHSMALALPPAQAR
ncbi:pleiotropic regulator 1-like [Sinocyclocheilus grahami]|uniref:pleiotropic regulator 1-like n=1 Tax=Sinocyclocheilus grahami TaxID=75366 RepID=UPI0007AC9A75|nr:PREDICTED: pleiotropic regulator 1-like [Sinocyclocheilus grahami]